jgi:hypothetical protein
VTSAFRIGTLVVGLVALWANSQRPARALDCAPPTRNYPSWMLTRTAALPDADGWPEELALRDWHEGNVWLGVPGADPFFVGTEPR